MNFELKNKELATKVFDKYASRIQTLRKWCVENVNPKDICLDIREFNSLCILYNDLDIECDDDTLIKRAQEFANQFKKDPTAILNKVSNFVEEFDISKIDTTKEADILKALVYSSTNQAYFTNFDLNPDYREARYGGSLQTMKKFDSICARTNVTNSAIIKSFYDIDLSISKLNHIPQNRKLQEALAFSTFNLFDEKCEEFKAQLFTSVADCYEGKTNYIEFHVNELWGRMDNIIKNAEDPEYPEDEMFGSQKVYQGLMENISNVLFSGNSFNKRLANSYGETEGFNNLYIDGKPLSSYIDQNIVNDPNQRALKRQLFTKTLAKAFEDGKPIDIAQSYMVNGFPEVRVYPIKLTYSNDALNHYYENELSKHSSFRVKFFNWGPFKIKTPVDHLKVNEINEKTFNKRSNQIVSYWEKNIKPNIGDKYAEQLEKDIEANNIKYPNRFKDFTPSLCGGKGDINQSFIYEENDEYNAREPFTINEQVENNLNKVEEQEIHK